MYKLFWSPSSGSFAPHVLLEEAGADYELALVDIRAGDQRKPEFLALNPQGRIPAMTLPDGAVMTESAAITLYLADRYPQAGLAPAPDDPARGPFLRWLFFMATGIYEADLRYYHSDRYAGPADCVAEVKAVAGQELDRLFGMIADALQPGPYLLGERFSALDVYLLMLASWYDTPEKLLGDQPRIKALCERVRARPAVADLWGSYQRD